MVAATVIQPETVGSRARRLRLALRLTQYELSSRSGVPRAAISSFEHNIPVVLDARRRIFKELFALKVTRLSN